MLRDASGDARVLEGVAETIGILPPAGARRVLTELIRSRDPGVLAATLEQLTLHVQLARALTAAQRDQLLRAPFELEEGPSIEARISAIRLARLLGVTPPRTTSRARAVLQATEADADVRPGRTTPESGIVAREMRIRTRRGTIVVALDVINAPKAIRVVESAARAGRYDRTTFHRVVPGFVAQGGDPRGDGYGGVQELIETELSGRPFARGAVGIAHAGLDTGGMQFFFTLADSPHLDARYPNIGHVVEGMELVDELMQGDVIEQVEMRP